MRRHVIGPQPHLLAHYNVMLEQMLQRHVQVIEEVELAEGHGRRPGTEGPRLADAHLMCVCVCVCVRATCASVHAV